MATYDWTFLTKENGYGFLKKDDYLDDIELPDHAILKSSIEI